MPGFALCNNRFWASLLLSVFFSHPCAVTEGFRIRAVLFQWATNSLADISSSLFQDFFLGGSVSSACSGCALVEASDQGLFVGFPGLEASSVALPERGFLGSTFSSGSRSVSSEILVERGFLGIGFSVGFSVFSEVSFG